MEDEDEEEDIQQEEGHGHDGEEFDKSSTIVSGTEDGKYEDIEINIEWDYKEDKTSDWAPMARAHRKALELLAEAVKTTSKTTTNELRELERRMQADHGPEDARARTALQALVGKFGSVAEAVTFAVGSGSSVINDIRVLRDNMNGSH
jgi:hypothetical protein